MLDAMNNYAPLVTAGITLVLAVLTAFYVFFTWRLVRQANQANGPLVFVDLELMRHSTKFVVGNAGGHPARNIRFVVKENLPWRETLQGRGKGIANLRAAINGIDYLAPGRTMLYAPGDIDQGRLFDGTPWSLSIDFSYLDHLGQTRNGSFNVGQHQYSEVLYESFQGPNAGVISALSAIERTIEKVGRKDDFSARILGSVCPTCGERVSFRAKKCPHCWEVIELKDGSNDPVSGDGAENE